MIQKIQENGHKPLPTLFWAILGHFWAWFLDQNISAYFVVLVVEHYVNVLEYAKKAIPNGEKLRKCPRTLFWAIFGQFFFRKSDFVTILDSLKAN